MQQECLIGSMTEWSHVELIFPKESYNQLILYCASKILNDSGDYIKGYYNREGDGEKQKLRIHVHSSKINLLEMVRDIFLEGNFPTQKVNAYKIIYNIEQDIADLIAGVTAQSIYLDYSISSLKFLFEWISSFEDKKLNKLTFAFDLMVMHILNHKVRLVYEPGGRQPQYPLSFLCYYSHSDGFLIRSKQEEKIRSVMEMQYQSQKIIFQQRFLRIQEKYYSHKLDSILSKWENFVKHTFSIIEKELSLNRVNFVNSLPGQMGDFYDISSKNIHSKMQGNRLIHPYISQDKNFQVIRLMTGLLYLTLHRLGISLSERYYLCYCITRAIEEIFSIRSEEALNLFTKKIKKRKLMKILSLGLSS